MVEVLKIEDPIPYLVQLRAKLIEEKRQVAMHELGALFGCEQFKQLLSIGCRETLALYRQVLDVGTNFVENANSIDWARRG